MECKFEQEKSALSHYKNTEYFDKSKYINASMSQETLDKIFNMFELDPDKPLTFLDFGCGTGETTNYIAGKFKNGMCVGIDYSDERMMMAERVCFDNKLNVVLVTQDVNSFVGKQNVIYDVIVAFEIIEHLVDADKIVNELKKMLGENGILILTIPYQDEPNDVHLTAFKNEDDVIKRLKVTPLKSKLPMRFDNQNIFYFRK